MSDEQVTAPEGTTDTSAPVEGQPFYTHTKPDGSAENYATREDLDKAYKGSFLRQSDYTQKSQANAKLRQSLDGRDKELSEAMKRVQDKDSEYVKFDKLVRERPDVYNQLKALSSRPPDANTIVDRTNSYVDEQTGELRKDIDEFKKWRADQEVASQKNDVYTKLSSEYSDFDRDAIESQIDSLSKGDWYELMSTLYFAQKGRSGPELGQRSEAAAGEMKARAFVPSPGKPIPKSNNKGFDSFDAVTEHLTSKI